MGEQLYWTEADLELSDNDDVRWENAQERAERLAAEELHRLRFRANRIAEGRRQHRRALRRRLLRAQEKRRELQARIRRRWRAATPSFGPEIIDLLTDGHHSPGNDDEDESDEEDADITVILPSFRVPASQTEFGTQRAPTALEFMRMLRPPSPRKALPAWALDD